jgi:hypothetical protein
VSYSKRFPKQSIKERQDALRWATRHVLIRVAKYVVVDGGIFEYVLVNCTKFVTWTINTGIRNDMENEELSQCLTT